MYKKSKTFCNEKKNLIFDVFKKTSKYLLIVESQSKISHIERILGKDYQIIATLGHICNIDGLKDVDIMNNFEAKYSLIESKKTYILFLRSIIEQYPNENIFLATDSDIEGEKIAYDICTIFDLPLPYVKRIIFNEITETAIKTAILIPSIVNMRLVQSQKARQILDLLIGYKITPLLWKYVDSNASAGRCLSVALKLIYENHIKNINQITDKKIKTLGHFFEYPYTLTFELSHEFIEINDARNFLILSKTFDHEVTLRNKKLSCKNPPKPFNTASLLQSSTLCPKLTMQLAQQLYQDGNITYMRTESTKYSSFFLTSIETFLLGKFDKSYIGDFTKITNLHGNLPHEAIRITDLNVESIKGDKNLMNLYKLIYNNTIESCMSIAIFNAIKIDITAPLNHTYKKTLEEPLFLGWKVFLGSKQKYDDINISYLQHVKKNVFYKYIESSEYIETHHHYSESTLIKILEDYGIGRPSTYATYGEIIQERGYVKVQNSNGKKINSVDLILRGNLIVENNIEKNFGFEKNRIIIQEKGILCIEFLLKYFCELFDNDFTCKMEDKLDVIKNYDCCWYDICKETNEKIKQLSEKLLNIELKTKNQKQFEINNTDSFLGKYDEKSVHIKKGRYGPYITWNNLNFSIRDIDVELNQITIDDAITFIESPVKKGEGDCYNHKETILRVVDVNTTIRKGKFGPYIYFKTRSMKKPKFTKITKLNSNYLTCDKNSILALCK